VKAEQKANNSVTNQMFPTIADEDDLSTTTVGATLWDEEEG